MSDVKAPVRPAPTYERDFYAWTQDQSRMLRELRPNSIDWENLAEEIETLGRSQRSEIRSRLTVVLTHLLKWAYQPGQRNNRWRASIIEARRGILRQLRDSPSLKRYPAEVLADEYEVARLYAAGETGLDLELFPETCPFTIEQILDPDFYPDAPAE
jgi:hypothetical protein